MSNLSTGFTFSSLGSMSRRRFVAIAATVAVLTLMGWGSAQAAPSDPVVIPDAALDSCIRTKLGIAESTPVTEADMASITLLTCASQGIRDLTGLEYATSLKTIDFRKNEISDVAALSNLTTLDEVNLSTNQMTDLSQLSGLENLRNLYVDSNDLTDLSPLATLTKLELLNASKNRVTDVTPLAGLSALDMLNLNSNNISDVSPLAVHTDLTLIGLEANQVTDISPLANMTSLRYLSLGSQSLPATTAQVGVPAPVPTITDINGNTVPIIVYYGSGTVTGEEVQWSAPGVSLLAWQVTTTLGTASSNYFGSQSVDVAEEPVDPIELSGTPGDGVVGSEYSFGYEMTADPAATTTVTAGALPDGLTMSSDGVISGVPTRAGEFAFTVTASNGVAPDVSIESTITVVPPPVDPEPGVAQLSLGFAELSVGNMQSVHGEGLTPGATVTFELHSTPVALGSATAANDGTVEFEFTVPLGTELGVHEVVATDVDGRTASASFTVVTAPESELNTGSNQGSSVSTLAVSGARDVTPVAFAGAVLLAMGAALLLRRREH